MEIEFDAEPALAIGYHKPTIGHPDDFVFDVIDEVLTEGVTSRLYSTLVRDKRLAASVLSDTNYPGVRAPNLFVIAATPLAPHSTAEVETVDLRGARTAQDGTDFGQGIRARSQRTGCGSREVVAVQ